MRNALPAILLITAIVVPVAMAQGIPPSAQLALEVSKAHEANVALIKLYRWKRSIEIEKAEENKKVTLELMRFDEKGNLQATAIYEKGGAEKKGDQPGEVQDTTRQIVELLGEYTRASSGEMVQFIEKAVLKEGKAEMGHTLQAMGTSFVRKDDEVSLWVDKKTRQVRRLKIATALGKEPVEATIHYETLKPGLSYPARAVVKIANNTIHAVVKTFDYEVQD